MSGWRAMMACVGLVLLVRWAPAQEKNKDDTGPFIERVQWGFGGSLPAERFAPVTVFINGGEEGFTGTVSLVFRQDASQETRILAQASATPGRSSPVELVAAFPANCDRASVVMTDGKTRREYRFSSRANEMALPMPGIGQSTIEILTIGNVSVGNALRGLIAPRQTPPSPSDAKKLSPEQRASQFWSRVMLQASGPELPLNWAAYQSVDVVVLHADALSGQDPRRIDALRTWIEAGGSCIIVPDVGQGWTRLLGAGEVLRLGDAGMLAVDDGVYTFWGFRPASRVRGRLVTTTPEGERGGWRTINPATDAQGGSGALVGVGPLGMGMVCVLASDPKGWVSSPDSDQEVYVWRPVVEGMTPSRLRGGFQDMWYWGWGGSLGGMYENIALRASVDAVANLPPPGVSSLVLIGGIVLAMGVLLGPVDLIVLKRLGWRHRSWLVAMGWIGLLSGVALAGPWVLRRDTTRVFAYDAEDLLRIGEGVGRWSTGVTSIFSGSPGSVEFEGLTSGGVWRGVSVIQGGQLETPLAFGELPIVQRQSAMGGREAMPGSMRMGQWMLRSFFSTRAGEWSESDAPRVTLERSGEQVQVRIEGLPESARVIGSRLWTSQGMHELTLTNAGGGAWSGARGVPVSDVTQWRWAEGRATSSAWYGQRTDVTEVLDTFSPTLSLPMAFERTGAIRARVETGRWACVLLEIEPMPGVVTVHDGTSTRRTSMRLVVPLDDAMRFEPAGKRSWPYESMTEAIR